LTFFFRVRGATLDDSVVAADGGDDGDAARRQVQLLGEFTKTLQQDPQHRADLLCLRMWQGRIAILRREHDD